MPRKRGVARKSFARRRIRRVKKWDHTALPRRFKLYLPYMADLLEENMPPPVDCEIPTMALLELEGVPTAEWPYYLGFMKRMLELYTKFTEATLQSEKTSLIEEYVLREKNRTILESVQLIAEECAGVLWELEFSPYAINDNTGVVVGEIELGQDEVARFLFLIPSRFNSFVHLKFFVNPENDDAAFDFDIEFEWERVGAGASQSWTDNTSTYDLKGGEVNEVSIPLTAVEGDPNPPNRGTVVAVFITNKEAANKLLVQRCSLRVTDGS